MFGVNNIVKNSDKIKYVYSGYGRAFDGVGSCSFGNGFAKNIVSFGFGNSLLFHVENCKNKF